jgi:serine/threonine protein kinase
MEDYKDMDEAVGTPRDRIIVLDTISRGRTFSVLKARRSTKFVTLKVANTPDAMYSEMLRREYELGATLSHGCIAATLGFEEDTELGAAIVMEYVEGVTLDKFIASKPSRSARERILRDILDGVEYLHHRGLLHNDLKPQNIIINRYGAARIIDFGLSASDDSLWSGCVGGSNTFSAPEILKGKGATGAASDIYSVGRLIDIIFEGGRYGRIVRRCVEEEPKRRYGSIAELRHAIARHRRRPFVVAGASFVVATTLALILPAINQTLEERNRANEELHQAEIRNEIAEVVNQNYTSSLDIVKEQQYSEFAVMARGVYTINFCKYRDALPSKQRILAEEIFVEHIRSFDSLIFALPKVADQPAPKRDSLVQMIENIPIPQLKSSPE